MEHLAVPKDEILLKATGVKKYFPVSRGFSLFGGKANLKAVDDVSFEIRAGETFGLVGESGCGKTTTAKMVLNLDKPTAGDITFEGKTVLKMDSAVRQNFRTNVQAVFQDPWSSLNPRMRVRSIVGEPMEIATTMTKQQITARVGELLTEVGLNPYQANLYPHEFSGGQRQRIGIARALALSPKLVVLDEPVSALDVSIRAQIMNLLVDLQKQHGLAYLLIAHNLATVRYMCHRVGVMYLGKIVEMGDTDPLFDDPLHPYTRALISAALPSHPDIKREEIILPGEVPSPINPPSGCTFNPRCPVKIGAVCEEMKPVLAEEKSRHRVSCHLYEKSKKAAEDVAKAAAAAPAVPSTNGAKQA
ncbi:MAG: ATP-binding cassette domain-containing protein [SAR202 cluster bacterium]|nr:ATP-binding cassette domain-containing protein [SAR202 cluster bacterium]